MEAIAIASSPATAPSPASASEKVSTPNSHPTSHLHTPISQAAAAGRIVGKPDIIRAAKSGNLQLVIDHVVVDAGCVHIADSGCGCLLRIHAPNCTRCSSPVFNFLYVFKISNFCYQW